MGAAMTGGPNEIWSFGEDNYTVLRDYILLRERLRPYIGVHAKQTSRTGLPFMRPLLVEFPRTKPAGRSMTSSCSVPTCSWPSASAGSERTLVYLPAGRSGRTDGRASLCRAARP